jgi:hypothetical protein
MITYQHNGYAARLEYRVISNHIHYINTPPKETSFSLVLLIKVAGGHSKLNISLTHDEHWNAILRQYEHTIFLGCFDLAEKNLHYGVINRISTFIDEQIISLTTK